MAWPPGCHNRKKITEVKLEYIGKCSLGRAFRSRRKNKFGSVLGVGETVEPLLCAGYYMPGMALSSAFIISLFITTILLSRFSLLPFCEKRLKILSAIFDVPHLRSHGARGETLVQLVVVSPISTFRSI